MDLDVTEESGGSTLNVYFDGNECVFSETVQNIRLYNLQGQLVASDKVLSHHWLPNTNVQGIYLLTVTSVSGAQHTFKVSLN